MAIKIFSDGSADLPKRILEQLDITLVPLSVHFEHDHYDSDMDLDLFYRKMKEECVLPKTCSPSPHSFLEYFKNASEHEEILCISLSSALSSTYHHALMGKTMFEEEHQGKKSIEVLDSKNASLGLGLLVYKAAKMAKEGHTLQEMVQTMKRSITEVKNYFVLDTLENVVKGGRLDRVRGAIASVLNIKLLMRASEEGNLEVLEKVRGTQNAIKKMIDRIGDAGHGFEQRILAIAHSNCEERAREVMEMILKRYPFKEVILAEMGPVIGTYAGEGGILVSHT
ncbi:MAG: domain protein DegV family [Paenibacillaceae bacterium]|jgi:DegV family protein with EDD domain|nr:domain protein DegV family [Paenibacillaceae bacterium]